jgi:hypothetical protein
MPAKNAEAIHALTTAEISRQTAVNVERSRQIVEERRGIYTRGSKGAGNAPPFDDDERGAREHARRLLNGDAPEFLSTDRELEINRDRALLREQRGIDIALKILGSRGLAARAAEAVVWAETNGATWRELCREIVLTVIRLDTLERRAGQLLGQCGDVSAVRLPMINIIGSRAISETPVSDLAERALAENVITPAEKRKVENG